MITVARWIEREDNTFQGHELFRKGKGWMKTTMEELESMMRRGTHILWNPPKRDLKFMGIPLKGVN